MEHSASAIASAPKNKHSVTVKWFVIGSQVGDGISCFLSGWRLGAFSEKPLVLRQLQETNAIFGFFWAKRT